MYRRLTFTVLIASLLGGCQQTLPQVLEPLECTLSAQKLADLIQLEARYADANPTARRMMRNHAIQNKQHLEAALMLSGANASHRQLEQALVQFKQAARHPPGCDSETYMQLREALTRSRLKPSPQQQKVAELEAENRLLQEKINALTGLESELRGPGGLSQ